jgi:hypothetical protein
LTHLANGYSSSCVSGFCSKMLDPRLIAAGSTGTPSPPSTAGAVDEDAVTGLAFAFAQERPIRPAYRQNGVSRKH